MIDLVFILLVSNARQPSISGPDTSLGGGFVLIVVLVGTNYLVGKLDNLPRFHRLFTPAPAIIVRDGQYVSEVMKREGVDQEEVEMSIRAPAVIYMHHATLPVLTPVSPHP